MTVSVAIGVTTRARPRMFARCLASLARLETPEDAVLRFIFVENDAALSIGAAVETFRAARPGAEVSMLLEPEPGIPYARNAVVEEALAQGCDWLAFLDDDEEAAPGWIAALLAGADGYDLVGGPVVFLPPEGPLRRSERQVFDYNRRMAEERRAVRAAGRQKTLHIATNNWLCRCAALRETGLRFDPGLRFTGGSDTDFSRRFEAAGARIGWVDGAEVHEVLPRSRLRYGYVFRRAKSQTMAKVQMSGGAGWGRALFFFVTKGLSGSVRILLSPVLGSYAGLRGLRALGVGAGWLQSALGGRSRLYERIHGG